MSIIRTTMVAAATLTAVGTTSVGPVPAQAATPECGSRCLTIFSHALGTYTQPNFVETVLDGVARVGQPVILSAIDGNDPSQDLIPDQRSVADFFTAGLVSRRVNEHFGTLQAAQIEFSPLGQPSGLCVGLRRVASQNQGLTLQPCSVNATTVWIIDPPDPPGTSPVGSFALVNGSTRTFSHPFAMSFPVRADLTDPLSSQIRVRRLQTVGDSDTPPLHQLWGAY